MLFASSALGACSPAAIDPEPPDLTISHGCGYEFALGNETQTVGLVLRFGDALAAENGQVLTQYSIPNDRWHSEVRIGRDLFSNWCDDVVEPGEPEPVVDERWGVTGTLEITSLPEPGTCGEAAAVLRDAVFELDNGGAFQMGDLALESAWGCFAG